MAIVYADRVREQTATTGTGTLTLLGAIVGHQTFSNGVGNGNESFYAIVDDTTNEWEVGRGTVGPATLSRDLVIASSNANALVNFGVGSKTVDAVAPSSFFAGALTTVDHSALNHTGIPGVPAPESFTSAAHTATDHTGLTGVNSFDATAHDAVDHTVPPLSLLDQTAHDAVDHTVPPLSLLDETAHDLLDHTGLPGVPSSVSSYSLTFDNPSPDASGAGNYGFGPADFPLAPVPEGGRVTKVAFYTITPTGGQHELRVNGTLVGLVDNSSGSVQAFTLGSPVAIAAGGSLAVTWTANTGTVPNSVVVIFIEP